jgi:hypothetical protein
VEGLKLEKKNVIFIGMAVYALLLVAAFATRPGGDDFGAVTNLYINIVTLSILIAAGIVALRYFGVRTTQGKSILMLVVAHFFWLLADVSWIYYDNALVSIADLFYFIGYPLILVGVFFGIKTLNPDFTKERKKIAIVAVLSVAVSAAYFWLVPIAWNPEETLLVNVLTAGYVVADIVILIPTLFLVSQVLSGLFSRPWILIAVANIINVSADIVYNLNYDTYTSGDILDIFWYFAYILYAMAFVMLRYDTEKMKTRAVQAAMAAAAAPSGKPAAKDKSAKK